MEYVDDEDINSTISLMHELDSTSTSETSSMTTAAIPPSPTPVFTSTPSKSKEDVGKLVR